MVKVTIPWTAASIITQNPRIAAAGQPLVGRMVTVFGFCRGYRLRLQSLIVLAILLLGPGPGWVSTQRAQGSRVAGWEWLWPARIAGAGSISVFMPLLIRPPGPTVTPTPSATFYDPFDDPNSGWPRGDDANRSVDYVNGEYQILIRAPLFYVGVTPGLRCADCSIELDGRFVSPNYGAWGILFGITDTFDAYLYRVNGAQQYSLYFKSGAIWQALIDWTPSAHIRPGPESNHLRVERRGTEISLYANGQHLQTVTDDAFVGSLRVGATASAFQSADVDVRLDNYTVYALSGSLGDGSVGSAGSVSGVSVAAEP